MFAWDPYNEKAELEAFTDVEIVIHLAGSSIADKRWSKENKELILHSRRKPILFLYKFMRQNNLKIKRVIGASAVGYYGAINSEKILDEQSANGSDFLAETCRLWEESYKAYEEAGISVSIVRVGVVLSKNGGAYQKLSRPAKMWMSCALGNGQQYLPWIHLHDLAGIFNYLVDKSESDVYNAVADEYITNKEFMRSLAISFGRKMFLPNLPSFLLKLVLGERAIMLLYGPKISNQKIKDIGYKFVFPSLKDALDDLAKIQ